MKRPATGRHAERRGPRKQIVVHTAIELVTTEGNTSQNFTQSQHADPTRRGNGVILGSGWHPHGKNHRIAQRAHARAQGQARQKPSVEVMLDNAADAVAQANLRRNKAPTAEFEPQRARKRGAAQILRAANDPQITRRRKSDSSRDLQRHCAWSGPISQKSSEGSGARPRAFRPELTRASFLEHCSSDCLRKSRASA